jgi:ubiquinol-cytochrome c reductase cytochrome b subunit
VRRRALRTFPPDQLLPDKQPIYVASWIYVFGVATIAAFIVVLATGGVLALRGPAWWHGSSVGHYVNSTHLWSVELFMALMVIHLWGKFFMAAWRGKRALTWITGAVSFLASIGAAFTGYLTQQNLASQWVSTQAKDGLNSVGAYFNVLDFGQMLMWHIVLLPLAVGVLVVAHVLLVRRHGVVPPFPSDDVPSAEVPAAASSPVAGSVQV